MIGRTAVTLSFLFSGTVMAADLPVAASCGDNEPVLVRCKTAADPAVVSCFARVGLVQQGPNTHIYGCELRLLPKLVDNLSIEVRTQQAGGLVLQNVAFNSDVGGGQSQVAVQLVRPVDQLEPLAPVAEVAISGRAKVE